MFFNFIGLTLFFGIGILVANGAKIVANKGKKSKGTILLMVMELLLLGIFLFVTLPSKNLSTVLWINLIGAVIASGVLLSTRLASKVEVPGIQKGCKEVGKNTNKTANKDWSGKILGVAVLAMILLTIVSSITRISSIDEIYQTIITAQVVNGEYVYVATVEFNGFFKWLKLGEVPGYFIISATDINAQPEFVEKPIVYTPSAYFGKDAARKIYSAYPGYAATGTINLELDDQGNPYYIQTLYKEYGVSGRMHYNEFKTAVLNATTGEVNVYDSQKAPSFVDAPITSSAANSLNEFFGRYSQGWWNQTMFGAKKDVKIPTENGIYASGQITPMMNKEGNQLLYFTDFTSSEKDQDSALGYSLINARTGQVTYYRDTKVGIMDSDGAISIASKIYPEKKWKASMPVLYNIDGVPTWIVSLMDSKGIFKKYVYINAVDNDIVIDADTAQGALDAYRIELVTKGSNNENTDKANLKTMQGKVARISVVAGEAQTVVSFLLEDEKTIFSVTTNNSPLALFLKEGDQVTFKAVVTENAKAANVEELKIAGLN